MATKYSIEVSSGDYIVPFVSGNDRTSLWRAASFFRSLASGHSAGTTLTVRNTLVNATGTITAAAVSAADTVTIAGVTLTATQKHATGTVTAASASVDDTVTVQGVVFTAKAAQDLTARQFDQSGTDTACATSLAACINAASGLSGIVTATSSGAVVTIRAYDAGTAGNALTLATSNNTRLAKSGTTLANGAAVANNVFCPTGSNTEVGADLARAINASTSTAVTRAVTASASSGVVTLTCNVPGYIGNSIYFTSSNNTRLAVVAMSGGSESSFSVSR